MDIMDYGTRVEWHNGEQEAVMLEWHLDCEEEQRGINEEWEYFERWGHGLFDED